MIEKTIEEWGELIELQVRDPDGFNRKDPKLMERVFTLKEFVEGLMFSTCMGRKDKFALIEAILEITRASPKEYEKKVLKKLNEALKEDIIPHGPFTGGTVHFMITFEGREYRIDQTIQPVI
jgi:hypothetical protein